MDILSQYTKGYDIVTISVSKSIDSDFIGSFVEEYKAMLREKKDKGDFFLEQVRILRFTIDVADYGNEQEFDLLFITYLALFKIDFPNIDIELCFENVPESAESIGYLYRLAHHNIHLHINAGRVVFRLFRNGAELAYNRIIQSVSYIPPIIVDSNTLPIIFNKKDSADNLLQKLSPLWNSFRQDHIILDQQRDAVFQRVQELYNQNRGRIENWSSSDLSSLYLIKALSELYVLRHFININIGIKSSYQIGGSIIDSKDDKLSTKKFRDEVMLALLSANVFEFNDIEIYIFSLIVQNSELFKIPVSIKEIYKKISPLLSEKERKKLEGYQSSKVVEKLLKSYYIEIYVTNLRRIINYTKDVCYGLEELAKNIVEHSGSRKGQGFGVISARIYNLEAITKLKKTVPEWIKLHDSKTKFLDINVIDSGFKDVISTYAETLASELSAFSSIEEDNLRNHLEDAYEKDLAQLQNFRVNNLFNFNSLKLLHQINRTKSRLGLLIFSQVILHDKRGFVSLSSNSLDDDDTIGYFLYRKNNEILDVPNKDFLALGTNLNFLIPLKETLEQEIRAQKGEERSSSASSVFQELINYGLPKENVKHPIRGFEIKRNYEGLDKYSKLESLRSEIGTYEDNEILLIDYFQVEKIIENSSDWIRFLAGLQFTSDSIKDIIIVNFDLDIYVEVVNILKLFTRPESEDQGFWKKGHYILSFIPVKNATQHNFWFNNVLCCSNYNEYRKLNADIDLYHHNLIRLSDQRYYKHEVPVDYAAINSKLFSTNRKLLNFELILCNKNGLTLFEETVASLMQIPIDINDENQQRELFQ